MKDNPALEDFLEQMGDFFDQLGVSRIAGRLFAVLLVCEPPEISARDLSQAVRASAASVNTQLRLLVGLGLVGRQGRVGSRQYLYRIQPGAWSGLLTSRLRMVSRFRELAELGLESVGEVPSQRNRLSAMRDFYAFFEREVEAVITRYLEQQDDSEKR
ncbi:MAG: GbsR/MarR family transcriptional regulator [Thermoanaerobaculia bacterium]